VRSLSLELSQCKTDVPRCAGSTTCARASPRPATTAGTLSFALSSSRSSRPTASRSSRPSSTPSSSSPTRTRPGCVRSPFLCALASRPSQVTADALHDCPFLQHVIPGLMLVQMYIVSALVSREQPVPRSPRLGLTSPLTFLSRSQSTPARPSSATPRSRPSRLAAASSTSRTRRPTRPRPATRSFRRRASSAGSAAAGRASSSGRRASAASSTASRSRSSGASALTFLPAVLKRLLTLNLPAGRSQRASRRSRSSSGSRYVSIFPRLLLQVHVETFVTS